MARYSRNLADRRLRVAPQHLAPQHLDEFQHLDRQHLDRQHLDEFLRRDRRYSDEFLHRDRRRWDAILRPCRCSVDSPMALPVDSSMANGSSRDLVDWPFRRLSTHHRATCHHQLDHLRHDHVGPARHRLSSRRLNNISQRLVSVFSSLQSLVRNMGEVYSVFSDLDFIDVRQQFTIHGTIDRLQSAGVVIDIGDNIDSGGLTPVG